MKIDICFSFISIQEMKIARMWWEKIASGKLELE